MRKMFMLSMLLVFFITACGKNDGIVKLKKDTPAYQLAKALSEKLAYLDPNENNPLATSKGFTISTGEVIQLLLDNSGNRTEQLKKMDPNQLKEVILKTTKRIGEQKLVLNEAKKAKFEVPPSVLDSLINLQYNQAGGEAQFWEMIQKSGANKESVKKDMRNFFIYDRYLDATLGDQIDISNEEVASVRHILLLTQGKSEAEKKVIRQRMEVILTRARSGEDFASLVKEYSEDPGSKDNGGLYENFPHGQMVKPFEDAAFTIPIGELSDIVETQYGYHILKIVDRKTIKAINPPDLELEKQLKSRKKPQVYQDYMKKLKAEQQYQEISF